jgi:ArsR family transcriptional regulator
MDNVEKYFKALADTTRLRILKLLEDGELCVCDLTASLDMTQPNISFHLSTLKAVGLITDRKSGRWSYYRLDLSDMMSRVVIPTALSRLEGGVYDEDKKRLKKFMGCKIPVIGSAGRPSDKWRFMDADD